MIGFENFSRDAEELEHEFAKLGVAIGIDWSDHAAVRALAREALLGGAGHVETLVRSQDRIKRARGELFALGVMMLRTMEGSAEQGIHTHGGPCWKAFGRALIEESTATHPNPGAGEEP